MMMMMMMMMMMIIIIIKKPISATNVVFHITDTESCVVVDVCSELIIILLQEISGLARSNTRNRVN